MSRIVRHPSITAYKTMPCDNRPGLKPVLRTEGKYVHTEKSDMRPRSPHLAEQREKIRIFRTLVFGFPAAASVCASGSIRAPHTWRGQGSHLLIHGLLRSSIQPINGVVPFSGRSPTYDTQSGKQYTSGCGEAVTFAAISGNNRKTSVQASCHSCCGLPYVNITEKDRKAKR